MTRLRTVLRTLTGLAPLVGGAVAVGAAVDSALDHAWAPAAWALVAAVWAFLYAAHRCPAPEPVERGLSCVHFVGGPEDGGGGILPGVARDLHHSTIQVEGADYRIAAVEQTCYRAELAPIREAAE